MYKSVVSSGSLETRNDSRLLDGADQSNDIQMRISIRLFTRDPVILQQFRYQARPFSSKLVRTGQGTVSTTHGETVDTELDEVLGGLESTFSGSDCHRNYRSALNAALKGHCKGLT